MKVILLVVAGFCHCSKIVVWKKKGPVKRNHLLLRWMTTEKHAHIATNLVPSSTQSGVVIELLFS